MMPYTTAISQNSIARIVPPAMPHHHLEYVHLRWLSEVVVHALDAAKCRFLELHRRGNFQNMSASVSINKFCLAMLDESISLMDTLVRAIRQLRVVGQGVQPNNYFNMYGHAAEPIVGFLDLQHEVDSSSESFDGMIDVGDSDNDSCDCVSNDT